VSAFFVHVREQIPVCRAGGGEPLRAFVQLADEFVLKGTGIPFDV